MTGYGAERVTRYGLRWKRAWFWKFLQLWFIGQTTSGSFGLCLALAIDLTWLAGLPWNPQWVATRALMKAGGDE